MKARRMAGEVMMSSVAIRVLVCFGGVEALKAAASFFAMIMLAMRR